MIQAAFSGDRLSGLSALRDSLAKALKDCGHHDFKAATIRIAQVYAGTVVQSKYKYRDRMPMPIVPHIINVSGIA